MPPKTKRVRSKTSKKELFVKTLDLPPEDDDLKPIVETVEGSKPENEEEEEEVNEAQEANNNQSYQHETFSPRVYNTDMQKSPRNESRREKVEIEEIPVERESKERRMISPIGKQQVLQPDVLSPKLQTPKTSPQLRTPNSVSNYQTPLKSPISLSNQDSSRNGNLISFLAIFCFLFLLFTFSLTISVYQNRPIKTLKRAESKLIELLNDPINPIDSIPISKFPVLAKIAEKISQESDFVKVENNCFVRRKEKLTFVHKLMNFCKKYPTLGDLAFFWFTCLLYVIFRIMCFIRAYFILLPKAKQIIRGGTNNQCFLSKIKTEMSRQGYSTFMCWSPLCSLLRSSSGVQYNAYAMSEPFFNVSSP